MGVRPSLAATSVSRLPLDSDTLSSSAGCQPTALPSSGCWKCQMLSLSLLSITRHPPSLALILSPESCTGLGHPASTLAFPSCPHPEQPTRWSVPLGWLSPQHPVAPTCIFPSSLEVFRDCPAQTISRNNPFLPTPNPLVLPVFSLPTQNISSKRKETLSSQITNIHDNVVLGLIEN